MAYETEKIEFKANILGDIYKEVIAFANTDGGILYIGINDDGEVEPLNDVDDTYTRITNGIRDAISPDVTVFVKYTLGDGKVIHVEIGEGSYKPYYLKSKGIKPSGVYVRQGSSSVQASLEQIRQMIKNADGDIFEELRSLEQELTFNFCKGTFTKNKIEFSEDKYNILGIRNHAQQLYTNLGWLLSDQCAHTIKIAVFADEQNTVFRDRKEFGGSVLRQLEETFDYLQLCNKNHSVIDGLVRKDFWDYPTDAVREALLNALIHRDYGFSGSIIINVNDKQMEFISIGGLLPGISTEDIRNGISQLRNENLAKAFQRLNFIETYGTGIRRIFTLYENCSIPVTIDVTPNSFKITLPNINAAREGFTLQLNSLITPQMQALMDYLKVHQSASDEEVQSLLHVKRTRVFNLTKQMSELGLVSIIGRGKNRKIIFSKTE
ncbi:MAG: putative DNA binding domain-containing protein [Defluviitaleaceae bacterium]|nr:putative DNA binding domain-containing protein [Defluviitaleaceae bacterium]